MGPGVKNPPNNPTLQWDQRFIGDTQWFRTIGALRESSRILVTSHASPDPDAYASSVGLAYGLSKLGKEVRCVNASGILDSLKYLPLVKDWITDSPLAEPNLVVITDCASLNGLGREVEEIAPRGTPILNIDHHTLSNSKYGDFNLVPDSVSCASELVYLLLRELEVPLDPDLATLLLAGIYNDTLSLQKLITTPHTFHTVAELVKFGGDLERFVDSMYRNSPIELLKFKGELLSNIETRCSGRFLPMIVDESNLPGLGLREQDLAPLKGLPLDVSGVLIGAFIRVDGDLCKVSLRSKGEVSAQKIAEEFGGHGHKNAAGLAWRGSVTELMNRLESSVNAHLSALNLL